jgi:tetratricopeptide (TPR) repeat protein
MIQTAVTNSFLISDSLDWYIQGLLASCESYYTLRQFERIEGIVDILENLPITEAQQESVVYYRALVYNWRKLPEEAKSVLEPIANSSIRAMLFLGTLHCNTLQFDEARRYYREGLKLSPNELQAYQALAILESLDGNHKGSLRELEKLLPLALSVRASQPTVYLDHLNSLAVEFGEVGRIQEAGVVSQIVLASPLAFAYPEWRETGQDLALRGYKSRSSVRVIQTFPGNIVQMPEREPSDTPVLSDSGPADVLSLEKWIEEKMVKEPNGDNNDDVENVDEMDEKDLLATLIQLAANEDVDTEKLRDVVKYAIKSLTGPKRK